MVLEWFRHHVWDVSRFTESVYVCLHLQNYLFLLELFILSCKYIACALKDALHLRLKAKIDRLHELKRSAS